MLYLYIEILTLLIEISKILAWLQEDVTVSLLDKCKQSLSIIKGIVESTTDDEGTLFEALYLNDELQQVVSKYEELEAAQNSLVQPPANANADIPKQDADAVKNPIVLPESFEGDEAAEKLQRKLPKKSDTPEVNSTAGVDEHGDTKIVDSTKEKDAESSCKGNTE